MGSQHPHIIRARTQDGKIYVVQLLIKRILNLKKHLTLIKSDFLHGAISKTLMDKINHLWYVEGISLSS